MSSCDMGNSSSFSHSDDIRLVTQLANAIRVPTTDAWTFMSNRSGCRIPDNSDMNVHAKRDARLSVTELSLKVPTFLR